MRNFVEDCTAFTVSCYTLRRARRGRKRDNETRTEVTMSEQIRAGDMLMSLFTGAGYTAIEPPVLQPAELFLDLSGEEMRRRMFVTLDANGSELCLRPEYTIPVCRAHLAARNATTPAQYCYRGPVFRLRAGETGEFQQAGVESIGRRDIAATDAEMLGLAAEALDQLGIVAQRTVLGDVGLLEALLTALDIPAAARARLMRAIVAGEGHAALAEPEATDEAESGVIRHAGLLAALEGQDPEAARAFVEDVLSIAGITSVGGRSAGDIARRFLASAGRHGDDIASEARTILRRYLAIAGDPDAAAAEIRALTADAGLGMDQALDLFEERNGFLAAHGIDPAQLAFRADFARNLDYYTGFIFDIAADPDPAAKPLAGGGRYDRLARHLDPGQSLPAIGCAFWLDRIAACRDSNAAMDAAVQGETA